ncbi:tRNA (adenosine(37)-N6)-dimethylallyltransferase MiaA [Bacillus lacus]|uniref:tRNA dimethylallyltransferase n=1 Tax=Metabacillus lacus TaxID=1983721 RepID=A0A7X2IVR1_9BACI|nr:tRNA (adenosine(37)-N6)-dimethylallyltransferase MiaA [Metabacillus lacus]MRX70683.1 tRNA (adenosine(37)-N6)-dimethylallyltransferase MiaA [Metabacillus lacus]
MNVNKQKVAVLIGPTAVGKTNMSIQLAKKLNAEIISGDSMQIYRELDIGTAKIKSEEMEGIPHHLIDIKEPHEEFSAAEFQSRARKLIDEIASRGKLPFIVGGTGLYIQSVLFDYRFADIPSDQKYRTALEEYISNHGASELYKKLMDIDPQSAERIHPNNTRRLVRALEIYHCTGITMTEYLDQQEQHQRYENAIVGLSMERDNLYERINRRIDLMMGEGLLQEVEMMLRRGLRSSQSAKAIGYKELFGYFDGTIELQEAVDQLKQNSRRYAKRQFTWFRNKMDVQWYDITPPVSIDETADDIFTYVAGKLSL